MDADQALADLMEISSQIEAAVIFDDQGTIAGATLADPNRAAELARRASELLDHASSLRSADAPPTQVEVATQEGSVFVVREGKARIVATTAPQPTVGLVFYDLKSALRQVAQKPAARKRRAPAKSAEPNTAPKAQQAPRAAKKPAPPRKKPASRKKPDET
jgi:predicted regulator of Ras-like GTPase activity (Roadblock/LC7/MglB family)